MKLLIPVAALALLFSSCANITPAMLSPTAVQEDITIASGLVINKVTAKAKGIVHQVAANLLDLSNANFSAQAVNDILTQAKVNIPASDAALVNTVINSGVTIINLAEVKFGQHNPKVVAYVQAVAHGLLSGGF